MASKQTTGFKCKKLAGKRKLGETTQLMLRLNNNNNNNDNDD
jgi:hypothetical protein